MYRLVIIFLLVSTSTFADVPNLIPYSGYITDKQGNAYNGTASFKFAIVDNNNQILWSNDVANPTSEPVASTDITVNNGRFSVNLGDQNNSGNALNPAVFNGTNLRLRVWFKGQADSVFEQFTPDREIVSVPYAMKALEIEKPTKVVTLATPKSFNLAGSTQTTFNATHAGYLSIAVHGIINCDNTTLNPVRSDITLSLSNSAGSQNSQAATAYGVSNDVGSTTAKGNFSHSHTFSVVSGTNTLTISGTRCNNGIGVNDTVTIYSINGVFAAQKVDLP